ncbi:MAG: hypothetical protein RMH77_02865 [Sulfolobales archaeon]|nr:hypothetical protein [Sulfolobales archaeon]MCX8186037.1 hypothetical protein [Sulfolobales archaeon]MDW7969332.1 hypothetical protein [Sulfolobales archaeon]
MKASTTYKHLKLVEYTSLPLAVLLLFYILSGYGMISNIPSIIGLNYVISSRIHTLPLLRYILTVLVIIHSYSGFTIVINRNLQKRVIIRNILSTINLAYALILGFITTLSEISMMLMP